MGIKFVWLSILLALVLSGCHGDRVRPYSIAPVGGGVKPETSASATASVRPSGESRGVPPTVTTTPLSVEPAAKQPSMEDLLGSLADAYFDFDRHDLRIDTKAALAGDASILKTIVSEAPNTGMWIEGHCDERGSAEYNLALGAMRAEAAKAFLVELGFPGAQLRTTSYGKERPQCTVETEECWQRNRRAHLAAP